MPPEPTVKRTVAFIDGQNLFHAVREAFGYTGIPDPSDDPFWNRFWLHKTDWITIDRTSYDSCLDLRDYRPTKTTP
ncbi:MAG TPA: hypothetical protein VF579_05440 [Candidatus Methylomirabilis sp.]